MPTCPIRWDLFLCALAKLPPNVNLAARLLEVDWKRRARA